MNWLIDLFTKPSVGQQVLAIAITAAIGLMIGKIKIKGIGLGSAGALFVGIVLGHIGLRVEPNVLHFIQEFGLILFVYTIGMQVGPGFVDSIRRHGLVLNILSTSIVLLGVIVTLCLYFFTDMRNNVPVLIVTGIGYAVAYPFGVIGIILVMILTRVVFKQNPTKAAKDYTAEIAATTKEIESCSLEVTNQNLYGTALKKIPDLISRGVVVTRLLRDEKIFTPNSETVLQKGDMIHIVGMPEAVVDMEKIIGRRLETPITKFVDGKVAKDAAIQVKTILVTNKKILGHTIGSLALAERYGVNVSRVTRSGFKFTGRLDLRIKFADKLMVVGTAEGIEAAAKELGNSLTALDIPEILPAFLGIFLGVIIGSIPIAIPGMPTPLKLGLAGGPLIVAIVLSRKRKIGPLNFFMASSANLMLREFGLTLFLSCVGLNAGIKFFDVLLNGDGLYYMALAAFITFIPIATIATIGHLVFKVNYLVLCGVLAGATTDPPALAFANGQADSEAVNIGYASVYPLTMLLRILSGQVLAILLLQAV